MALPRLLPKSQEEQDIASIMQFNKSALFQKINKCHVYLETAKRLWGTCVPLFVIYRRHSETYHLDLCLKMACLF